MSSWQELFDKKTGPGSPRAPADGSEEGADIAGPPDPTEYRPWILQRGGRPALFLDLRRFEPRTGILHGCQMSYPHLVSVDYVGDRLVHLDFGSRRYAIEGEGLCQLVSHLQQGQVLAIQEYSAQVWKAPILGPRVKRIIQVEATARSISC
jgi:hypothetical protein